ncbi:hypothetical protein THAOC_25597, partial [Thalassiosira oceanica]
RGSSVIGVVEKASRGGHVARTGWLGMKAVCLDALGFDRQPRLSSVDAGAKVSNSAVLHIVSVEERNDGDDVAVRLWMTVTGRVACLRGNPRIRCMAADHRKTADGPPGQVRGHMGVIPDEANVVSVSETADKRIGDGQLQFDFKKDL